MHSKKLLKEPRFSYSQRLLIFPALISIFIPLEFSHAGLASKSNTKKSQIKQIETDLSREKEQYLKYGIKEKDLLGQLTHIEKQITEKRKILKEIEKKLRLTKIELKGGQEKLRRLEESLKEIEKRLGKRLIAFYKYAKRGYVQLLASSTDLGQLRKRMKYLQVIMDEDQRLLQHKAGVQLSIEQEVSQIKERVAVIDRMEKAERSRLLSVKEELDKKVLLLMKIHKEKEFYETAVKELQLAAQDLKETLLNLDKSQDRQKPLPSGFAVSKRKLPLPFKGKIMKNHKPLGAEFLKTHRGIFIEGRLGAEVKAVFPGRVDFSGWLKGYGQTIVINHGSRFFTISAHLSQRQKQKGDTVEKGEVIGLLGETGSFSGPRLYFEIRRAGTNLDPLKWIKVN